VPSIPSRARTPVATVAVLVVLSFALFGCSGPGNATSNTANTGGAGVAGVGCGLTCGQAGNPGTNPPTTTSTLPPVTPAGCDQFCLQAGPSAGNGPSPCGPNGCLPCPSSGCLVLDSESAFVIGGVFTVSVTCQSTRACDGALAVYEPSALTSAGRLGGADVSVPALHTSSVVIRATPLGSQLASPAGYNATAYIVLHGSGYNATNPSLLLHT
jgi:hypothetical protein